MTRSTTFAALAALLLGAVTPAAAQRLSITPQIGFYVPTEKLTELAAGGQFSEIEAGPSFGARLGLWFGSRIGIEAGGAYVPTTFKVDQGSQNVTSQDAKLFVGSGQLVVFLLPRTGIFSLHLNGGVGVVSRGGVAFTSAADKSDLAATVGAGAGVRLGVVAVTVGADLMSYTAGSTVTNSDLRQKDVHLKLGLGIPFGH
jgi:hypothetical protein